MISEANADAGSADINRPMVGLLSLDFLSI